jgi:hypothetical protein
MFILVMTMCQSHYSDLEVKSDAFLPTSQIQPDLFYGRNDWISERDPIIHKSG